MIITHNIHDIIIIKLVGYYDMNVRLAKSTRVVTNRHFRLSVIQRHLKSEM